MLSPFIPAGELLGPECQIRTVVLAADPYLPDGEYTFLDTYCTDNTCDCRKTIIQMPPKVSRNAPCPCGSGKKYKNCCL